MRTVLQLTIIGGTLVAMVVAGRSAPAPEPLRVWLHAHNCYPDEGVGADRLRRALAARRPHETVAIEQDLVWDPRRGESVISHDVELLGGEPTLDEHFFRAVASDLDAALAAQATDTWPLVVLHLDFKTNEAAHHQSVWALLGRYERWLTTAPRDETGRVQPLRRGPLLVLTENGEGQEHDFHDILPPGAPLRVFGTVPGVPTPEVANEAARLAAAAEAAPEALIPTGATNYRRWTNHSWAVVERGGQRAAQDWSASDRARLEALVGRAHALGLWIRFYTLNGHPPNAEGWSDGYNFGTLAAATARWRAAIDAGVDFIGTDQYEDFSALRRDHDRATVPPGSPRP
jgi:hypothetical protein